ncbi:MAG: FIST domain containing protein [Comamonadaceae bacterium]|nr:MAG: FIST domain containing protein [Comamonadaceae bacterium]
MSTHPVIRRAHSCATEARQAVRELHAELEQADTALVVFFCSSAYDLDALADEINQRFAGIQVMGCTTAGEIGPAGYCTHSLVGVSFSASVCTAVSGCLDNLQKFEISRGQDFAQGLLQQLESRAGQVSSSHTFAFLLVDGLSIREEPVVQTLQSSLGEIALCGGSAGDDFRFERTWVFHGGAFHTDSAVLVLVNTPLPFKIFKTQHFVSDSERLVVTEADVAHRIVMEINGLPAAEEYARILGIDVKELTPLHYAATPVVVVIDGTDYVRAIQKVDPAGPLTFFCAIDEGLVLRVAHGVNLIDNLTQTFDHLREDIGPLEVTFGCDCILRNIEISNNQQKEAVGDILKRNHTVGFSTYGEQFGGVHVNQTFTGIAIGSLPDDRHA